MSDRSPGREDLPALHEGRLDDEGLARFERDLNACARIDDVRVRAGPSRPPAPERMTLDAALAALRAGEAAAVQIRYRHDGRSWLDTLMRAGDGVRLVRVAIDG